MKLKRYDPIKADFKVIRNPTEYTSKKNKCGMDKRIINF